MEIKKDISNDVYLITIVQNNLFDNINQAITEAHIRFAFSDITGNEYIYTAEVRDVVQVYPEESVSFEIESVEDCEAKLDERIIQVSMNADRVLSLFRMKKLSSTLLSPSLIQLNQRSFLWMKISLMVIQIWSLTRLFCIILLLNIEIYMIGLTFG